MNDAPLPLETLRLAETAAGTPSIRLTNQVSPDGLAAYVRRLLSGLAWGSAPHPGSVARGAPFAPRRSLAGRAVRGLAVLARMRPFRTHFGEQARLGGTLETSAGGPFEKVCEIRIGGHAFWLACDEAGVSLEPRDRAATALVPDLYRRLLEYRG